MHYYTTNKPKKLYKGKKRLASYFLNSSMKKKLLWALSISPGDYVSSCEGCNRKVKSIRFLWENEGEYRRGLKNKTWVLFDVLFTDTNGSEHWGLSCCKPPQTRTSVIQYLTEVSKSPNCKEWYPYLYQVDFEKAVDEFGEFHKNVNK